MIRAVVFDVGGVLCASPPGEFAKVDDEYGLPPRTLEGFIRGGDMWVQVEHGRMTLDDFSPAASPRSSAITEPRSRRVVWRPCCTAAWAAPCATTWSPWSTSSRPRAVIFSGMWRRCCSASWRASPCRPARDPSAGWAHCAAGGPIGPPLVVASHECGDRLQLDRASPALTVAARASAAGARNRRTGMSRTRKLSRWRAICASLVAAENIGRSIGLGGCARAPAFLVPAWVLINRGRYDASSSHPQHLVIAQGGLGPVQGAALLEQHVEVVRAVGVTAVIGASPGGLRAPRSAYGQTPELALQT